MSEHKEIHDHYRKYLMHIENKTIQMITFRLADSLPREVIERWKIYADNFADKNKKSEEYHKLLVMIDKYEDAGLGECLLKNDAIAEIMKQTLLYNDKKMYELICWCIMPNHVHVLIKMLPDYSLSDILFAWRSFSAHTINKRLHRKGQVWMSEYFDRYIRNQEHFLKAYNYILNNPVKAGLATEPTLWRWSSVYKSDNKIS